MIAPAPTLRFRLRPEHLELVRAALAPRQEATRAFRQWRRMVRLEDTDAGSYRLIPLLHHNLRDAGVFDDTEQARFAHMTRFTWVKTTMIINRVHVARDALAAASIDTLAIKGLAVMHHGALGSQLRPMDDADLLVHPAQVADALRILSDLGYYSDEVDLGDQASIDRLIGEHHGLNLHDPSGVQVDLHWHAIPHALHPEADTNLWRRSRGGLPGPEDTFVGVLAHAIRWSWSPSVQWIADAIIVAQQGLDWSLVSNEIRAQRISVPVADALAVLEMTRLVEIPAGLSTRLRRAPISQRIEGRIRRDPQGRWRASSRTERLADAFGDHVRRSEPPARRSTPTTVQRFLVERWALSGVSALPAHALFVALHRPWRLAGLRARQPSAIAVPTLRDERMAVDRDKVTTLRFDRGGNGLAFLRGGWSFPENHGSWTIGTEAAVAMPCPEGGSPSRGSVRLHFELVPFLCENIPVRRVDVIVGSARVARWRFEGTGWSPRTHTIVVAVPPGSASEFEVRFIIHEPISPQAADHDVGTRQLGMSLCAISIMPAS